MSYEVEFYETESGRCPTDEFLNTLKPKPLAKVHAYLELLEERGPNLTRPFADGLRDKIRELRPDFAHEAIRLLYFFFGKTIVVTHGFRKKTERTPPVEIERAIRYMRDSIGRRPQ